MNEPRTRPKSPRFAAGNDLIGIDFSGSRFGLTPVLTVHGARRGVLYRHEVAPDRLRRFALDILDNLDFDEHKPGDVRSSARRLLESPDPQNWPLYTIKDVMREKGEAVKSTIDSWAGPLPTEERE